MFKSIIDRLRALPTAIIKSHAEKVMEVLSIANTPIEFPGDSASSGRATASSGRVTASRTPPDRSGSPESVANQKHGQYGMTSFLDKPFEVQVSSNGEVVTYVGEFISAERVFTNSPQNDTYILTGNCIFQNTEIVLTLPADPF